MNPERFWGTWNPARPAEMLHVATGFRITPLVYAASTGKASWLSPQEVTLGSRTLDSSHVELAIRHAGTELDWRWTRTSPISVQGQWKATKHGEWGLRFWVTLCLSGGDWRWQGNSAYCTTPQGTIFVNPSAKPLLVTAHETLADVAEEFEKHGYWYLNSRGDRGPVLALRFNLDEMPEFSFNANFGLSAETTPPAPPTQGPLAAIRDIMGWNSSWDPVNQRPYTSCTRNWDAGKFGGFGVWLTDTAVNAMLLSTFDAEMAQENFATLRAHQTEAGNFPCLITGHDAWPDRSQPPLVSLTVWLTYQRDRDKHWLEDNYEALAQNHAWWWSQRDGNGNGILEYGSSIVGDGLYVGTKLAAKDESFMDNSPMHDEARWNEKSRTLDMEDVGLNSLITLDCEILALMARELGRHEDAYTFEKIAEKHRKRIQTHFWDASRNIFANRLWSKKFVDAVTPTSFYPLLCGAADAQQTQHLLAALKDPNLFGGEFGLPSVARSHPSFNDNVYWRGRIWPILNWLVWLGLKRADAHEAAAQLLEKSWKLFTPSWEKRLAPENFNAKTGEGLDQPDTDSFYSWTALLPFLKTASLIDIDPWEGWVAVNEGEDMDLGPMRSPWGMVHAKRAGGVFQIIGEDGSVKFETREKGRVRVNYPG